VRILSPKNFTLNTSNVKSDLVVLRIISGNPKIDGIDLKEGKMIHITKAVQFTAALDLLYFYTAP